MTYEIRITFVGTNTGNNKILRLIKELEEAEDVNWRVWEVPDKEVEDES